MATWIARLLWTALMGVAGWLGFEPAADAQAQEGAVQEIAAAIGALLAFAVSFAPKLIGMLRRKGAAASNATRTGLVLLMLLAAGCGASLASILANVPGVVTTILNVVDEVSEFLSPQLDDVGKAELAEIVKGIHDTAAILEAAVDGSLSLTEGEVSAAFDRLEELYKRLVNFGGKYGVRYSDDGRMSASGATLRVPKYEAIK